jgi:DNA-binding response OmpR family regulator
MPQPNDLSRSLVALDQDSTIIAVVEMSQWSWLVGGMLPGIELVRLLEQAGHRAAAVMTVSEASSLVQAEVPELLATDAVLADGSSTNLVQQAAAAGAKTLMMTGSPDRMIEFDGAGQPYLSKPFPPDVFLKRVQAMLAAG